jgi:CSLREA domain-containing protein
MEGNAVNPCMLWLDWLRVVRVIGFSIAGSLLLATGAPAQVTFNVNTTNDGVDINPGDGNCSTVAPPALPICTLRAAVMEANRMANAGAIIMLPAGTYKLSIGATIADGEENGDLNMIVPSGYSPGPTTISGAGAASTIIDAQGIDRVLRIDAGRTVSISGVSMINGFRGTSSDGAGIFNAGTLVLSDCVVSHNNALVGSSSGGGIVNQGGLQATRVTFSDNHVGGYGGGIANNVHGSVSLSQSTLSANSAGSNGGGVSNSSEVSEGGFFTLDTSTVAGNMAGANGGGIYSDSISFLDLIRSTVSGNNAVNGGGVYNGGHGYVLNSTISGNSAAQNGGGYYSVSPASGNFYNTTIVFNRANPDGGLGGGHGGGAFVDSTSGSILNVRNTVLAGNTVTVSAFPDDCYGTVGFFEKNQVGTSSDCFYAASSTGTRTLLGSVAEFGPLQDNGGPTRTHALVPPSSMINGGSGCVDQNSTLIATDQRGRPRPPYDASFNSTCDLGAFEYNEIFHNGF